MIGRIIKAAILGWIGKKVYDHTLGRNDEPEPKAVPAKAKRSPTRTTTRTVRAH